jgi:hypothetical protein
MVDGKGKAEGEGNEETGVSREIALIKAAIVVDRQSARQK